LAPSGLFWVEEPTHAFDVTAHAAIARAISPVPVAVGESIPNRVVFKNFMQAGAVQIVQADPTRIGGVSECLVVAMMAKKFGLRVIPHVGDMGQLSQHLVIA
jgi:L-fuconate dehydratase